MPNALYVAAMPNGKRFGIPITTLIDHIEGTNPPLFLVFEKTLANKHGKGTKEEYLAAINKDPAEYTHILHTMVTSLSYETAQTIWQELPSIEVDYRTIWDERKYAPEFQFAADQ
ncbi:hypothetical protein [Neptuniibacter sp. QD37_11]|uniref:hypothetical protein n=1 Tax=Neptuniibacter sp. QD37_11 TaxID=3398209 RepID=UPI0039F61353